MLVFLVTYFILSKSSLTTVSIDGTNFKINGKITFENAANKNMHGLLINSRMINAIFDDENESTQYLWLYPDTHKWDPNRNTNEFVGNLSLYKSYGMNSFTVGLQGGNPFGYGRNEPNNISGQPWINTAYDSSGNLKSEYFARLDKILEATDKLNMVPIVQMFYGAQIHHLSNDNSIMNAINNTLDWLMSSKYTNFLIEVTNECNGNSNDILDENGMPNTIKYIREYTNGQYLIGSSLTGGHVPTDSLITASDMILLHGNGQSPSGITNMIDNTRATNAYKSKPKPIIINEDDHYDFTASQNNFKSAVDAHTSWGIFVDCNQTTAGDYIYGYQCVPAAWNINTPTKIGFFNAVKNYAS